MKDLILVLGWPVAMLSFWINYLIYKSWQEAKTVEKYYLHEGRIPPPPFKKQVSRNTIFIFLLLITIEIIYLKNVM